MDIQNTISWRVLCACRKCVNSLGDSGLFVTFFRTFNVQVFVMTAFLSDLSIQFPETTRTSSTSQPLINFVLAVQRTDVFGKIYTLAVESLGISRLLSVSRRMPLTVYWEIPISLLIRRAAVMFMQYILRKAWVPLRPVPSIRLERFVFPRKHHTSSTDDAANDRFFCTGRTAPYVQTEHRCYFAAKISIKR